MALDFSQPSQTFGATALFTGGLNSLTAGVSNLFASSATQYSAQQALYQEKASQEQAQAAQEQAAAARTTAYADILQKTGDILEAQQYQTASALSTQEAQFTEESTAVQSAQAQRQLYMTLGTARAAAAGGGGTGGGSAADIVRNSAEQGALNQAVIVQQGAETAYGYTQQAEAYSLQAQAAQVAAKAQVAGAVAEQQTSQEYEATAAAYEDVGLGYGSAASAAQQTAAGQEASGILGIGSSVAQLGILGAVLLSDMRFKTDITPVGMLDNGLTVYSFRYKHDPHTVHIGLLAQEVEQLNPAAVTTIAGVKYVDYGLATHATD